MKICFAGYFGTRNTGDELLLDAAVAGCRKRFGDFEINVLAAFPGEVAKLHDFPVAGVAHNTGWARAGHVVENKPVEAEPGALALVEASDVLVICGGGLWGNGTVYAMHEVQHAARYGKPVYAVSMGVDPFALATGKAYRENYFRHLRRCTTRDVWGARCLEYIGVDSVCPVVPGADSVFGLFRDASKRAKPDRVHICICNNRGWKNHIPASMTMESTAVALARGIGEACMRYRAEPVLFPFSPDQGGEYDLSRSKQFAEQAGGGIEVFDSRGMGPRKIFEALTDARVVVSERYHACIMAACAGVPFVALCMDHKLREIARAFGMPHIAMAEHMIESRIYAALCEVLDPANAYAIETTLRDRLQVAQERATLNFDGMVAR